MAEQTSNLTRKLAPESNRPEADSWSQVYLHPEGTFLRAFNQSAWLMAVYVYNEQYRATIPNSKPLQVSRVSSRNASDYIVAGFPSGSLGKFAGPCPCSTDPETGIITLSIPAQMLPAALPAEMQDLYDQYFASLPAKPERPARASSPEVLASGREPDGRGQGVFDIIKLIVSYSIEEHTPLEAQAFLADVKRRVGRLL